MDLNHFQRKYGVALGQKCFNYYSNGFSIVVSSDDKIVAYEAHEGYADYDMYSSQDLIDSCEGVILGELDSLSSDEVEIYNGTTHEFKFYTPQDTISIQDGRKLLLKYGAIATKVISPGKNLNCVRGNLASPKFNVEGINLKGAVSFLSYDPLPTEAQGKLVIVSLQYRNAVKELGGDTTFLCVVDGTIFADDVAKKPCGCLGLNVG